MALLNDPSGRPISKKNIKAGYPEIFFAPAITVTTLDPLVDAGWRRLGQLMPGSLDMNFGKAFHDVPAGFPETVHKRFFTSHEGSVGCTLNEFTPYSTQLANGSGIVPTITYPGAGYSEVTAAASTTRNTLLIADADVAGLVVGDLIEIEQGSAGYGTWYNYLVVKAIGAAGSGGGGNTVVTVDGVTDFLTSSGATVKVTSGWDQYIGGNDPEDWQIRIKVSLTDGGLAVVHVPLGNFVDPYKLEVPDKQHNRQPLMFKALGQLTTIGATEQVTVARQYFRKAGS